MNQRFPILKIMQNTEYKALTSHKAKYEWLAKQYVDYDSNHGIRGITHENQEKYGISVSMSGVAAKVFSELPRPTYEKALRELEISALERNRIKGFDAVPLNREEQQNLYSELNIPLEPRDSERNSTRAKNSHGGRE